MSSKVNQIKNGEYWIWQGDGEDHLESLVCLIVITPEQLKDLIAKERADAIEKSRKE